MIDAPPSPTDRFAHSGISWFRGISMRLAEQLIELGLADARAKGQAADEELATADLLYDVEHRQIQRVRVYTERWGWSKSSAHRLMQRLGVESLVPSALSRRPLPASANTPKDGFVMPKNSLGQVGTTLGQRGTESPPGGTDLGQLGTEPPEKTPESPDDGTELGQRGTAVGQRWDSVGQVWDSPYSDIQKYIIQIQYPLPPGRAREAEGSTPRPEEPHPPPRTPEETIAFGATAGVPPEYCEYFFEHYDPVWCDRNGRPVTDWTHRLRRWWRKDATHWQPRENANGRQQHRRDRDPPEARAARAAEAAATADGRQR